jgi:hypothetical protein
MCTPSLPQIRSKKREKKARSSPSSARFFRSSSVPSVPHGTIVANDAATAQAPFPRPNRSDYSNKGSTANTGRHLDRARRCRRTMPPPTRYCIQVHAVGFSSAVRCSTVRRRRPNRHHFSSLYRLVQCCCCCYCDGGHGGLRNVMRTSGARPRLPRLPLPRRDRRRRCQVVLPRANGDGGRVGEIEGRGRRPKLASFARKRICRAVPRGRSRVFGPPRGL